MSAAEREHQLRCVVRSFPQCYDDLSPELIAEEQFVRGVRRLSHDSGGPTAALRSLVDGVRHGTATVDALDTVLDALEAVLCIPQTAAGPALADGTPDAERTANARFH